MLSAAEIAGLKNDLRDFYNKFPKYTTLGSFYQLSRLAPNGFYSNYIMKYITPEDKVLDLGCGAGIFTLEMARIAKEVVGIDFASNVVDFANRLKKVEYRRFKLIEDYRKQDFKTDKIPNVSFQIGDAEELPFKDQTFNLIVAQDLIEHLPAPVRAISEMYRCLQDKGKIILIYHTPDIDINLNIDAWQENLPEMKNKDAVSKMNYNLLKSWFKRNNKKIIESKIIYTSPLINLLSKVFFWLYGSKALERYEDTLIFVLVRDMDQELKHIQNSKKKEKKEKIKE